MTRRGTGWSRPCTRIAVVVVLILAFCPAGPEGLVAPAHADGFQGAAPRTVLVGGYFQEIAGNRTRMIQVGCVIGAIGIFLLTRNYR